MDINKAPIWKTLQYGMDSIISFTLNKSDLRIIIYLYEGNYTSFSTLKDCNFKLISNSSRENDFNFKNDVRILQKSQNIFLDTTNCSFTFQGLVFEGFQDINNNIISLQNNYDCIIENCTFLNQNQINSIIYIDNSSNTIIKDSFFLNNSNNYQILLFNTYNNNTLIENNIFYFNKSPDLMQGKY